MEELGTWTVDVREKGDTHSQDGQDDRQACILLVRCIASQAPPISERAVNEVNKAYLCGVPALQATPWGLRSMQGTVAGNGVNVACVAALRRFAVAQHQLVQPGRHRRPSRRSEASRTARDHVTS